MVCPSPCIINSNRLAIHITQCVICCAYATVIDYQAGMQMLALDNHGMSGYVSCCNISCVFSKVDGNLWSLGEVNVTLWRFSHPLVLQPNRLTFFGLKSHQYAVIPTLRGTKVCPSFFTCLCVLITSSSFVSGELSRHRAQFCFR